MIQVSPSKNIPINAVMSTMAFTVVLSLVLIGSDLAFNVIASIGASAILGSYIVSISTLTYRRINGYKLLSSTFSLGRLGLPINILALCFLWLAFVMVRLYGVLAFISGIANNLYRSSSQLSRIRLHRV